MRFFPEAEFGNRLLEVEKPARYLGGEFGIIRKENADFRVALSFPDLYEIAMSNQAVKILYRGLNELEGVACERVFSPDLDYEALLRAQGAQLSTLECGIPLREADILAFTVGYELCGTGILCVLDLGGVPLRRVDRTEHDPIVIGGGMALTNPRPFSEFFDAVWIGEAEAGFFELVRRLREAKLSGAGRSALLALLAEHASVWIPGKSARRAVFSGFASSSRSSSLPVATVKPVQDHGVVEIMRGCPNGCRFCHAGYAYRPCRYKSPSLVLEEVEESIRSGGFREITLSSLSSGDYPRIERLMKGLSIAFAPRLVSFQLPSLRVSTFNLPLIESLSRVRKSGLTFAVETPREDWQTSLNKEVRREKVLEILAEAAKFGWKSAKFYFMIGLPMASGAKEEVEEIYSYVSDILRSSRFELNLNVGVFVPKAHTPFERAAQLPEAEALDCLLSLKRRLPPRARMSFHSPFVSILEGLISRGDERSGELILEAFRRGLRLEAWEEHREMDAWREVISLAEPGYLEWACGKKESDEALPWDSVDMGVARRFLRSESERSREAAFTAVCSEGCHDPCGSCNDEYGRVAPPSLDFAGFDAAIDRISKGRGREGQGRYRLLFSFSKEGIGRFYPHLTVVELLSKAFCRAGIDVNHSQGFNPQPKLEIAHPLAMGVESRGEAACVELSRFMEGDDFIRSLNPFLPEGLRIETASCYAMRDGLKNPSLASLFAASEFEVALPASRYPEIEEIKAHLSNERIVTNLAFPSPERCSFIVVSGKTKEEQPLSPLKHAFSDSLALWPRVVRTSCLCAAQPGEASSDRPDLLSFDDYFRSYYAL